MSALLRCAGITKEFPGVRALSNVDFDVERGEIHALVGENGAGKSTLMHILAGVHRQDAGIIEFSPHGPVHIVNERHAQQLGIAIVYQERSLFDLMSVAENVLVENMPVNRWGLIDRKRLKEQTRVLLERVNLPVDPGCMLSELSPAQQQMVEIAKALSIESRLLILDEPTAALTFTETETLYRVMRQLQAGGVGIVYISHRLEEVFHIADRVTVLKDGQLQGTMRVADTCAEDLVTRMVGRQRTAAAPSAMKEASGPPALEVTNLCDKKLRNVSFSVASGEIVTLSGLAGAGRTEIAMAIFGERPLTSGEIFVSGRRIAARSPREAMDAGIGYLTEDRKDLGVFAEMPVAENIAAARLERFGEWNLNDREMARTAASFMEQLRIACPDVDTPVGRLSGGNQQKVLLARWLLREPKVLIVDEPTRGVDVNAKLEIHTLLRSLAAQGTAIVAISSDLPEVLALGDRVLVMRHGRLAACLPRAEASEERIMRFAAMAGEEASQ